MIAKRSMDLVLSFLGLIVLIPLFCVIACWIKYESPGPVFFRQIRVGQYGRLFRILKFRTMTKDSEQKGGQITVGEDPRITSSGRLLRRYKLDELPQLINVLRGEMSLVGPRPEVPRYVSMYPAELRDRILSVPPGMSDYASIEYKDENRLLGCADDPEKVYIEEILPVKLSYYERYVSERTLWTDIRIIFTTIKVLIM